MAALGAAILYRVSKIYIMIRVLKLANLSVGSHATYKLPYFGLFSSTLTPLRQTI
jgi:hypothetical protein